MPGPESPGPREEEDTGGEAPELSREDIEGRAENLSPALTRVLNDIDDDLDDMEALGVTDDEVLESIEEDVDEEEDALTEVLVENGMSPEEAEAWEIVKNLNFDELFGQTEGDISGMFSQMVLSEMGISEEQWMSIWEASPGMQGYAEAMSRGYTETQETYEREQYAWDNPSHFTVPKGYETHVTSNPQANRGTVRNKEGRVVSRGGHKGVDLGFRLGTPLIATTPCEVIKVSLNRTKGMSVTVRFQDGTSAMFGHLDEVHVKKDDVIGPGSVFGKTGNTGYSTGPHLHLQTYDAHGDLMDPFHFIEGSGMQPKGGEDHYHFPFGDHEGHDH